MPDAEARAVVPRGNPAAEVAQQLGGGLQSAGQSIMRVEEINRLRVNRARVKEADAKLSDGYRKILSPADGGYRSLLGRGAIDGREDVQQALQKHRESILGTLDPEQRDMISASESALYQQALGSVDGHFAHQLQAFEIGESEARADQALRGAFEGFFAPVAQGQQDPKARTPFEENRVTARTELSELARLRGYGPAQEATLLQKADDTLHASVVEKLTEGDRAVEAAKFIEKFGGRLSPDVRDKLQGHVREAGETEQAESVAAGLLGLPGSLTEKLDRLGSYREGGHVSTEVAIKAERRLLQMSEARRVDTDRAEADAFDAARIWAQTNRTGELPAEKRRALGSRAAAFDLWALQGNQFITTGDGEKRLAQVKPEDLLYYKDQNQLVRAWETDVSPKDLRTVVLMWQKARGEQLNPKDAVSLDRSEQLRGFLSSSGFYEDNPALVGDKDTWSRRVGAFELAVQRRLAVASKEPTNDDYDKAIHAEYSKGRVLNGKWVPEAMLLTADERRQAQFTPLDYDLPDTEEDFVGYTRAGKQVPLVPSEQLASREGVRQVVGDVNQRLADGSEVRVSDSTALLTGEEIRQQLIRGGVSDPTPSQIAARSQALQALEGQKRDAAKRIVSLEDRLRARSVVEGLPSEIDAEFSTAYAKDLAAWDIVRYDRLSASYERGDGTSSGSAGPAPTKEQRAAVLDSVVRIQSERGSAVPAKPSVGEVWRAARDRVLARHASLLGPYNIEGQLGFSEAGTGVQKFTTREGVTSVSGVQSYMASGMRAYSAQELPLPQPLSAEELGELAELKKRYLITEKTK